MNGASLMSTTPMGYSNAQQRPMGSAPPGLVQNMNSDQVMGVHPNPGPGQMPAGPTWFQDAVGGMGGQHGQSQEPQPNAGLYAPYGPPPAQQYSVLQQPQVVPTNPMEQMLLALTQSTLMTAQGVQQMAQQAQQPRAAGSAGGYNNAFKSLKPKTEVTKITGATEEVLFDELHFFERDLHDLGILDFAETAFYQLKNAIEGSARDIVDLALFEDRLGIKAIYHRALALPEGDKLLRDGTPGPGYMRHQTFTELYAQVMYHLRLRSNLTDRKIRDLSAKYKTDARMVRDTPEDAKAFLKAYRASLVRQERAHTRSNLRQAVE